MFVVVVSAAAVVGALVLTSFRDGGTPTDTADGAAPGGPLTLPAKVYDTVPDGCDAVSAGLVDWLVPGVDGAGTQESDGSGRESSCTWASFGAKGSRQLAVELRAVAPAPGANATAVAGRILGEEWRADRAGREISAATGLFAPSTLSGSPDGEGTFYDKALIGVGDGAYATYSADKSAHVGEAIVNVRVSNVLITVNHSGGNDGGGSKGGSKDHTPLPEMAAIGGGIAVAKNVIERLHGIPLGDSPS